MRGYVLDVPVVPPKIHAATLSGNILHKKFTQSERLFLDPDWNKPKEIHRLGDAHVRGRFPKVSPDGSLLLCISNETGG